MSGNFGNMLSQLLRERSFCLQKVSRATFASDVIATHHRRGERVTKRETEAIIALVRSGEAFRCRIGKGRFVYGRTVSEAISGAIQREHKRNAKRAT